MIYLLFMSVFVLMIISYALCNQDFLAPPFIVCATYLVCILFAYYNERYFDLSLHNNTYAILMLGILSFVVAGVISYNMCRSCSEKDGNAERNLSKKNSDAISENEIVYVDSWKLAIIIIIDVITFVWYFKEAYRISLLGGNTMGYSGMLQYFRAVNSYSILSGEEGIPTLLNQLVKLNKVFGYVFLYVFINNVIKQGGIKKNLKCLIPVMFFACQTLLTSNRFPILYMVAAAFVMYYVLDKREKNWVSKDNTKYIKMAIKTLILVFAGFFLLRNVVGHNVTSQINDPLYYITKYVGGGINLFDLYLQDVIRSDVWGEKTFAALYKTLTSFGIAEPSIRHFEFRSSNGIVIGNVYGAFRRYYQDFGITGVIIFPAILACIYNLLYSRVKKERPKRNASFRLLMYAFIIEGIFFMPIDDFFFSSIISVNYVTLLILLKLTYMFIFDVSFSATRHL